MNFVGVVEDIGEGVDVAGITIILVGVLASSVHQEIVRRLGDKRAKALMSEGAAADPDSALAKIASRLRNP